jgi:ATP-dependent DNA ligase
MSLKAKRSFQNGRSAVRAEIDRVPRPRAIKRDGKVYLRSRNDNDFNKRYPGIVKAHAPMPDDTVIDGEVVALDEAGRPSFNSLQNHGSAGARLHFFIFDLLVLGGHDVMNEPLTRRRELIEKRVLPKLGSQSGTRRS